MCLSNQIKPGREWFPSPLGDFNRLFEGLIGELFKIWHWNMFYFFNDFSLAPKMWICTIPVLVKACWMQCPLHNQKVKTNLVSMVPHANWHHSTVRQSEHTKYSTYQQQCNGSKCSLWGMKMTILSKLVEFSFIPCMSASAIECRSIGSCSRSGLCAGLMITGLHFQLLLTLPPSNTECQ